jgi:hypothetical protein
MDIRDYRGTPISGWFLPAQGDWLRDRAGELQGGAIALVGIYQGLCLSYVVDTCRANQVKVHAVDVWEKIGKRLNGTELPWPVWMMFRWRLGRARAVCQRWIRRHGLADCVEIVHASSTSAARSFADGSLDLVFLDADHSYEAVSEDLAAWYGKLKQGGLMAGHDWDSHQWPGVIRAVEAFAGARGVSLSVERELWSLRKP